MTDPKSASGNVTPNLQNRIRVSYARRITVRLGDLDAVFEPVTSVLGKKQRLQALGHYYETIIPATGDVATEAYTRCLASWQAKRERALQHPLDATALEAELQAEIRRFIVSDGVLPVRGSEVKVRLPGTFTFRGDGELSGLGDGSPSVSARFWYEERLWAGNRALGRIPITFKVEKRMGGVWRPAPDEGVLVHLIAPFYDDEVHELDDVNALRSTGQRPEIWKYKGSTQPTGHGIQQFLKAAIKYKFEGDPQRYNAHADHGGKRSLPPLQNLFDRLPAEGFPDLSAPVAAGPHAVAVRSNARGEGGVAFLPSHVGGDRYRMRIFLPSVAGLPSDSTEPYAVVFETGRFTVWKHVLWSNHLVKPAPTFPALNSAEGVRARLALLGYDTGPIDSPNGATTAVFDYQFSHYPLPQNARWDDAATQAALDATVTQYLGGGGPVYPRGFGPKVGPFLFEVAKEQFRQMYCELEIEPEILTGEGRRSVLTPKRYQGALRWAISQFQASQGPSGLSAHRDISAMFSDEFETPFLFEIRHPRQYNRMHVKVLLGRPVPDAVTGEDANFQAYWNDAANALYGENGLHELFLRYLTGDASDASPPTSALTPYSTPGFTLVSAMSSSRLNFGPHEAFQVKPYSDHDYAMVSGIATKERAASVFGGVNAYSTWTYLGDGYTKNSLHEVGHLLHLRHQFTKAFRERPPSNKVVWRQPYNIREDHDSPQALVDPLALPEPVAYDRCLMGYLPCDGDFCGKCLLAIRGWNLARMPV